MPVRPILDTLRRTPQLEATWRHAAFEIGAVLGALSENDIAKLMDGIAMIGRDTAIPDIALTRATLLSVLSGRRHALEEMRARHATDAQLLAAKPFLREVATAIEQCGGVARHGTIVEALLARDARRAVGSLKTQVTNALDEMTEHGLVEELAVPAGMDQRARVCRLLPAGQRLAELGAHVAPPTSPRRPQGLVDSLQWSHGEIPAPPAPEVLPRHPMGLRVHDVFGTGKNARSSQLIPVNALAESSARSERKGPC